MQMIPTKGKRISLECVESTNTYLKELSKKGLAKHHDYVTSELQTKGRGRLGRSFSCAKGKGIYLSYLVDPGCASPEELSRITAWGAVAARDAIAEVCGITPSIKWVNDLVVGTKKLCGILTETVLEADGGIKSAVMGIGINVNQDEEDFPLEIREIACSLKQLLGRDIDREALTLSLVRHLDRMNEFFPDGKKQYLDEYRKSCIVPKRRVRIISKDTERVGTALGIDDDFGLCVLFDDGKKETITGGDVSVRGFYGYV